MRTLLGAVVVGLLSSMAVAEEQQACEIPGYLLSGNSELKRVAAAVKTGHSLTIAVVGTGSSALAGPRGPSSAYPARLEAVLKERLPTVTVRVIPVVRTQQTAEEMAKGMPKVLADERPDVVIWQTGTFDAIRRVEPDDFRAALDEGIDAVEHGGADIVLMNMQYSPRTEIMLALDPYADTMRVVAQQHEVPLFDRLSIMRHWSDTGAFDLHASRKDNILAARVHDCIAHGIADVIMEAGHLRANEQKVGQ
jgi:lysophospholipase L1-like esterase